MSKFFKELPPREGFAFNYQPSKLDHDALFSLNRTLGKERIRKVREKYHRACLSFDDLKADLFEYKKDKAPASRDAVYYSVLESVKRDLAPKEKLIPSTTGAVTKHRNFPGQKSPGLPLKTQGYRTKRDAVSDPNVMRDVLNKWHMIGSGSRKELPDAACYARAQVCSVDKNKIRATWGYPLEVYLEEARFFYPMLDHLLEHPRPHIAYGLETAMGGMGYIDQSIRELKPEAVLMLDWSKFDKTVPAWLIRDAFSIISDWIEWSEVVDSEGKVWHVRGYRSRRRWARLVEYFIETPIRMSDGTRFLKIGGVPSGSCFTNLIDSIVNMIVTRWLTFHKTGSLPLDDFYLGDDGVVLFNGSLNMTEMAELASSTFGLELNVSKSYWTRKMRNVKFLGYFNFEGVPYKPLDTTVVSALFPERPVLRKMETISRLIGQAYSCFDAAQAASFFAAAEILMTEEGVTQEDVEAEIHSHPHHFKYLSTLGLKKKKHH